MPVKEQIANQVKIAATAIIEEDVIIGDNCIIGDYTIIRSGTKIGANNKISPHVIIGGDPQDLAYKGETSYIEIGDNNTIREFTTIHKATGENQVTRIGNNNMFMVGSHVGHNCELGNNIIMANNTCLGGYVRVEDNVTMGGGALVHQHCRIGKHVMMSGQAATNHDLVPYFLYMGVPAGAISTNRVGLKRAGYDQTVLSEIMRAFKIIYSKERLNRDNLLHQLETQLEQSEEIKYIIDFIKTSKRGVALNTFAHKSR